MFVRCKGTHGLFHMVLESLVTHFQPVNANHCKVVWQQVGSGQVVQGRHEQTLGEVAAGAKNDDAAGRRAFAV